MKAVFNILASLWISKIFLVSLTFKFTDAPETLYIFGTIGDWMKGFLGETIGQLFADYGAYGVGTYELIVSIVLILGILLWTGKKFNLLMKDSLSRQLFQYGGIAASLVMFGAIFFHLASPLGVAVEFNGQTDNGSLFYSAVSICVLGIILFFVNRRA